MSSRTSVTVPLELPSRPWADRMADGLGWLAAGAVAWVCARHGSVEAALALGAMTAAVLRLAGRGTTVAGPVEVVPGGATRRLGPTLVVQGRSLATARNFSPVWLTPGDLPSDRLRRLWVELRADHRKSGS